jgi:hypothetical protein
LNRENERAAGFQFCQWTGNSQAIAREHYLQVTDEYFVKAAQPSAGMGAGQDAQDGAQGQATAQSGTLRKIAQILEDNGSEAKPSAISQLARNVFNDPKGTASFHEIAWKNSKVPSRGGFRGATSCTVGRVA